jgi:hypothetical protein
MDETCYSRLLSQEVEHGVWVVRSIMEARHDPAESLTGGVKVVLRKKLLNIRLNGADEEEHCVLDELLLLLGLLKSVLIEVEADLLLWRGGFLHVHVILVYERRKRFVLWALGEAIFTRVQPLLLAKSLKLRTQMLKLCVSRRTGRPEASSGSTNMSSIGPFDGRSESADVGVLGVFGVSTVSLAYASTTCGTFTLTSKM